MADGREGAKRRRGESLNKTVIELLSLSPGVGGVRSNGLAVLAGRWIDEEFRDFEGTVVPFEELDLDLESSL